MLFNEDELLDAVDILVEDYGLDEDEAIEIVLESYEEELNIISEAVDILVEDYGFDEDYAIDLASESYREKASELANHYFDGNRQGMTAMAAGTALGLGAWQAYKGAKQLKKSVKRSYNHHRNLRNIKKYGRRLNEDGQSRVGKAELAATLAGIGTGLYMGHKATKRIVPVVKDYTTNAYDRHNKRIEDRNRNREYDAIVKYRRNKLKKRFKK